MLIQRFNELQIVKMTQPEAEQIAAWKYEPPYDFYNMTADMEDLEELLDPEARGDYYFTAHADEELVGFYSFIRKEESVEIGLALRPDLTGQGLGAAFIKSGLRFIEEHFGAASVTLAVALFNKRAIKVYERLGFQTVTTYMQPTNGSHFEFVLMHRDLEESEVKD